jgi:hypothetical protein
MRLKSPIGFAAADTTAAHAAIQDFARQAGRPYSLLYVRFAGGRPDLNRCLRVVQRGPNQFTAYSYLRPGQVDSTRFSSPALASRLQKPVGHFTTTCLDFSSEARYDLLWVRQGHTTVFSLGGEDAMGLGVPSAPRPNLQPLAQALEREGTPFLQPADSVVLQPGVALLQEVARLR